MNKEQRNCNQEISAKDNRTVEGYAVVFNSDSRDLGGFTERINPDALDALLNSLDGKLMLL